MRTIPIEAELRQTLGRRNARRLRRQGWVPAILYGANIQENGTPRGIPIQIKRKDALTLARQYRAYFVELQIPNHPSYKTIVKEIQFHPVTDEVIHIDFQTVVEGRKIVLEVPVQLKGVPEGVVKGGMLVRKLRKVRVEVLPEAVEEVLEVDVSHLDLGQSLRIRDLARPGWRFLYPEEVPVATVEIPRRLRVQEQESAQ